LCPFVELGITPSAIFLFLIFLSRIFLSDQIRQKNARQKNKKLRYRVSGKRATSFSSGISIWRLSVFHYLTS
jgi:hypothetical protein